jgi:hypothetical protein
MLHLGMAKGMPPVVTAEIPFVVELEARDRFGNTVAMATNPTVETAADDGPFTFDPAPPAQGQDGKPGALTVTLFLPGLRRLLVKINGEPVTGACMLVSCCVSCCVCVCVKSESVHVYVYVYVRVCECACVCVCGCV